MPIGWARAAQRRHHTATASPSYRLHARARPTRQPDNRSRCRLRGRERAARGAAGRSSRRKGLKVATGTIVDATIINAPSSTKNADKTRDPEMHQAKKGNQWYFGMKGHFGVDSRSKLIHAVVATPANVADSTVLPDLLHGNETPVWGD